MQFLPKTAPWTRSLLVGMVLLSILGCGRMKRSMYEPGDRDEWQQPVRVIESLTVQPGDHVADVGAGGGYFTFRLADAVGAAGKVYAVDVDTDMTSYLEERATSEGYENVEVLLTQPAETGLRAGTVDLFFTCNTYHHIEDRETYFSQVKRALRPGGRVAIIDHKPEGWFQRIFPHSTKSDLVREEMESAGYRLLESHDYLEKQNFQIFAPAEE